MHQLLLVHQQELPLMQQQEVLLTHQPKLVLVRLTVLVSIVNVETNEKPQYNFYLYETQARGGYLLEKYL